MRLLISIVVAAAALAGAVAQAGVLSVALNHSERLRLSGSAASVVVGDSSIADVTVIDSRTVFVSGKRYGATNVAVMDALGRTLFASELVVGAPGSPVTVFRGAERMEMACTSRCGQVSAAVANAPTAPTAQASPLAGLMSGSGPSALGDALAGFAHAATPSAQ